MRYPSRTWSPELLTTKRSLERRPLRKPIRSERVVVEWSDKFGDEEPVTSVSIAYRNKAGFAFIHRVHKGRSYSSR